MNETSVIELIKKRKSTRTYKSQVLEENTIKDLQDLISSIDKVGPFNNEINYQLVILDEVGIKNINKLINYGFIKGSPGFIAGTMKENENYLVDFGYLMEDIILKTTGLSLDTCWLGGSLNTDAFKDKLSVNDNEQLPAIFSIGIDAKKTRRFDNVIRSTLKGNNRKSWSDLFFEDSVKKALDKDTIGLYQEVLEMVRLAPSACNKQPWRIIKESDSNTYHLYLVRDTFYSKTFKAAEKKRSSKNGYGYCNVPF